MTISSRRKRRTDPVTSHHHHHIPEEIIEGILVRLPLKSFIRFQCVSKSWFNLIKNNNCNRLIKRNDLSFIVLCFIHKSKRLDSWCLNVFLFDDDYDDEKLSKRLSRFRKGVRSWIDDVLCDNLEPDCKYPLPAVNFELEFASDKDTDIRAGLELVGYCNGVMCLTDYDFILLVNPIIKEVKKVSNPIKPSLIGFGFDDTSREFKVVRILVVGNRVEDGVREFEAEVYDVKRNVWRELGVYPLGFYDRVTCSTFFNGVIHWCVEINTRCWRILTFNVATELFQLMEFPQGWQGIDVNTPPRFGLFVFNQHSLAFVDYSIIDSSPTVNLWIMNNKRATRKSWMCLYSIRNVPQLKKPISIWKKNKLIYETKNGNLAMYDIVKRKMSVMYDGNRFWRYDPSFYSQLKMEAEAGVLYGSSLISMNT